MKLLTPIIEMIYVYNIIETNRLTTTAFSGVIYDIECIESANTVKLLGSSFNNGMGAAYAWSYIINSHIIYIYKSL